MKLVIKNRFCNNPATLKVKIKLKSHLAKIISVDFIGVTLPPHGFEPLGPIDYKSRVKIKKINNINVN